MGLNLSKFDTTAPAETGSVVELDNPFTGEPLQDDEGKPVTWTLRGMDSPQVRAVIKRQQNKRNDRIQKGRGADMDADTLEAQMIDRLVAATITFDEMELNGETLQYSPENARKILSDSRFAWLSEQLNTALGDRKRFLTTASTR